MSNHKYQTSHELSAAATQRNSAHMLPVSDWLADLPENTRITDLIEVQFKQTRKGYFHNTQHLPLEKGVKVVVESTTGYDLGEVVLTGKLVELQMKKNRIDTSRYEVRQVIRIATDEDLERAAAAHAREQETMIKARQLAKSLGLEMKIGDVEYQGDGTKAIFYYIADGRVDFRQLIKVYAETFRIRVEMKQIGARQEAGRIGGTGPCGRELCCSTWMINFSSVGTGAARLQNISPNPQKLAGMCAKLKCCLNYEVPVYEDASKHLPPRHTQLETRDATYYLFSTDPLAGMVTYSSDPHMAANLQTISAKRAHEIIAMNNRGEKPDTLEGTRVSAPEVGYQNVVGHEDVTRFDRKKKKNKNKHHRLPMILMAVLLLFSSCRNDIVYSHFQAISGPSAGTLSGTELWHADSAIHFEYRIEDTSVPYQTIVYIRHTERYPYQNMWLFTGDSVQRDTIEFYLADDRGQWLGNRHHGFIEMPVLLEEGKQYLDTGVYILEIRHGMRDTLLRGITDVGVEVIKIKN